MTVRTLQVCMNGALVGTLRDANNIWAFQYDGSWLAGPCAFALAPSLALTREWLVDGASARPVQWFFDNLLPEELMRQVLAKEVGVESTDAFGMLNTSAAARPWRAWRCTAGWSSTRWWGTLTRT